MANIEFLSGVGAIGFTYHSCPYWKRSDGRPSLHISMWFLKVIIFIPYQHVTPEGHGTGTSDYGVFWWPKAKAKPTFSWRTLK